MKAKNTYRITYKDGTQETIETTRELTGVFGFKNSNFPEGYGYAITTRNDTRAAFEANANKPGRDWLTDWHIAEFEKIN